jgi:hypothetical protein
MNRLLLVLTIFAVAWTNSCSGGSSTPPPPPSGGFNNASLKGNYVFSMTGTTADPNFGTSSFSRVGVFSADGGGGIATTGGLEDVHAFGADNIFNITGGSYVVNADGRGTLNLMTSGGTVQYSIALGTSSNGYIVDMDSGDTETASGSFSLQTSTAIATGTYAFDFSGIIPDGTGNPVSIVGDLVVPTAGTGSFTTGSNTGPNSFWDVNDNGTFVTKASIPGVYATDTSNAGTGRGLATIGGLDFVYYVIDSQHVQFMGIDQDAAAPGTLLGEATAQQAGTPNDVTAFNNSSFVFVMGGTGGSGPLARAGRLTATGGSLSAILLDNNNAGTVKTVPPSGVLSAGTVTLDGDGSGRGTFTFTDTVSNTGTFTFVFYLSSATSGVIQDVSTVLSGGIATAVDVADGTLLGQVGAPFTSSSLATAYAFNWSGADPLEEDFVGAFQPANASPNGLVDYNELSASPPKLFFNVPFNGVVTIGGDGTGSTGQHSTFVAGLTGSPAVTINYFAYIANPSTILVMGTDSKRVIVGVLASQTP